jgi:hypothetical protein
MKKFLSTLLAAVMFSSAVRASSVEVFPNGFLDLQKAGTAANLPTTSPVPPDGGTFSEYYATDTGALYVWNPSTAAWVQQGSAAPLAETALFTAPNLTRTYLLSAVAGFVVTLPAATGSGNSLSFVVKTTLTSGAYEISCAGSDTMGGTIIASKSTTSTPYQATAGTTVNVTLTNATVGAGIKGDRVVLKDVAAGLWEVEGTTWVTGTVATPFS